MCDVECNHEHARGRDRLGGRRGVPKPTQRHSADFAPQPSRRASHLPICIVALLLPVSMPRTIKGAQKPKPKDKDEVSLNEHLQRIHALESGVLESRAHANNIALLLGVCKENAGNFRVTVAATTALRRVLVKLARQGDFHVSLGVKAAANKATASASAGASAGASSGAGASAGDSEATQKYQSWLHDKYRRFVHHLLGMLRHDDARLQVSALHLLMDFVALECELRAAEASNANDRAAFFADTYWATLMHALANPHLSALAQTELLANFVNAHDDLRLYACKAIKCVGRWRCVTCGQKRRHLFVFRCVCFSFVLGSILLILKWDGLRIVFLSIAFVTHMSILVRTISCGLFLMAGCSGTTRRGRGKNGRPNSIAPPPMVLQRTLLMPLLQLPTLLCRRPMRANQSNPLKANSRRPLQHLHRQQHRRRPNPSARHSAPFAKTPCK